MTNLRRLMIHNRLSRRKARSIVTLFQQLRKLCRKRLPQFGALPLD